MAFRPSFMLSMLHWHILHSEAGPLPPLWTVGTCFPSCVDHFKCNQQCYHFETYWMRLMFVLAVVERTPAHFFDEGNCSAECIGPYTCGNKLCTGHIKCDSFLYVICIGIFSAALHVVPSLTESISSAENLEHELLPPHFGWSFHPGKRERQQPLYFFYVRHIQMGDHKRAHLPLHVLHNPHCKQNCTALREAFGFA